jgi:hypothetical protein
MYYFRIWMSLFIKNSNWNLNQQKSELYMEFKEKKRRLKGVLFFGLVELGGFEPPSEKPRPSVLHV